MTRLRLHISVFLIALMALTGQGMAMARGMPMSVGTMELCSGQHTVIIAVDANGEPTAPQHHCLDCTLLALGLPDAEPRVAAPDQLVFSLLTPPKVALVAAQRILRVNARAPPRAV
ncbi:DUF2946 family protein [Cognatishimia activa]|uniref:DUF2946 family protein n=1 Tax=Cognatishimia activa TaxID=1715691 RepID=UPI00222FF4E7|nr:DUF2946 family protein [Cognatishimia activa]UZD89813.1 hypothetical protein M0D42_09430 [Cognatishimia activa]